MFRLKHLSVLAVAFVVVVCAVRALLAGQPPQPPWFDSRLNETAYPPEYDSTPAYYPVPEHYATPQQYSMPQHRPQDPHRLPNVDVGSEYSYSMPQHRPQPPGGVRVSNLYPTPPLVAMPEAESAQRFPPVLVTPAGSTVAAFRPGQIIAWVGDQPIQAGDLLPMVEQTLAPYLAKMPPEALEAQKDAIDAQRENLLKQALASAIDTKLLYLDFLRSIPADKLAEALPNITARAEERFHEMELPSAIEKAKVASAVELEAELRKYGSSLANQKRSFVERILAQSMLRQEVNYQPEVTHMEMADYWRENEQEFDRPAKARWEKLSVRFDRSGTREEAWVTLGNMGNEVLRGAPFAAVAQRHSQGVDAGDGGYHDWTTKGSLASDVLDSAIFTLPVGQLSERLEDEHGFHIVRVIERDNGGPVPFLEAQVDIQKKLRKQKVKKQINEYVARLKKEVHVWTIFDRGS